MSNEIVKYHHELNTIPLRKFTPVETNLFFSIVSRMRDVDDKKVQFTFKQLKDGVHGTSIRKCTVGN
ncbi:replication initiation protein [Staphylococcus aureus]|uniref:replication initiation protein n=1 Tax=Staphylococcus aureus TaxID=1280 RepID=UPI0040400748